MKKILVTGGTGFIGYHLVKRLLETTKDKIYVTVRAGSKNVDLYFQLLCKAYKTRLSIIVIDLSSPMELSDFVFIQAVQFDQIYHLATILTAKGSSYQTAASGLLHANRNITENIKTIVEMSNAKLLFISTIESYYALPPEKIDNPVSETSAIGFSDPRSERWVYAFSKVESEVEFSHSGINYFVAKLTNVYGPRMTNDYVVKSAINIIKNQIKGNLVAGANDTREYVYVNDVVGGLIKLMEKDWDNQPNHTVIFAGKKAIKTIDLFKLIAKLMGCELILDTGDDVPELRNTSSRKAKGWLNWEPEVLLEDGLKETIKFYA
jgi:nucleoside-diphosphate-sugar epimerase